MPVPELVGGAPADRLDGTFMAGSADGVPRKPVHGGHGAADAAIHAPSSFASSSSSLWLCNDANSKLDAIALSWVRV